MREKNIEKEPLISEKHGETEKSRLSKQLEELETQLEEATTPPSPEWDPVRFDEWEQDEEEVWKIKKEIWETKLALGVSKKDVGILEQIMTEAETELEKERTNPWSLERDPVRFDEWEPDEERVQKIEDFSSRVEEAMESLRQE